MTKQALSSDNEKPSRPYMWRFLGNSGPVRDTSELQELLLAQRGIDKSGQAEFLEPNYEQALHAPSLLSGMSDALDRIDVALAASQRIAIYGDYDIDGITATALLLDVLTQLGANVEPYIPDRFEEGYGLNSQALKSLKDSGVGLVISVDCGITAAEEVALAKDYGLDIIITDHHSVPGVLPSEAMACINPRLPADAYPFKELAGVGVAFKLACALASRYPEKFKPGREKWWMDLLALGTVCDVVPLVGENRALVQFGLMVLHKSQRKGLRALAEVSGVEIGDVLASDLGFRLGPRLNAAGRLEHAAQALELLTTQDTNRAKELAANLNHLNRERQEDTSRVYSEAMQQAEQYPDDAILVLSDPTWSHGIVGLVASRVSEALHKPAIIFQELGEFTKGSARSIGAFNIIEAVSACGDMLERFGGHAFAAGMTLRTNRISDFRKHVNEFGASHRQELAGDRELVVSCTIDPGLLSIETVRRLSQLEPFGNGNSQPVFATTLKLSYLRPVGSDLKHFQMRFTGASGEIGAIAFSGAGRWPWLEVGQVVEVACKLSNNIWQGVERLQLEVQDVRPA